MNLSSLKRYRFHLSAALALLAAGAVVAWMWWPSLPRPGSPRHEEFSEAFWIGTAALDSGLVKLAEERLSKAIRVYPYEPAAFANRGLGHLRNGRLDAAAKDLEQAIRLAPGDADIEELLSLLRERQNRIPDAIALARKVALACPADPRRQYRLADLLLREGDEGDAERQTILQGILAQRPTSLPLLAELLSLSFRKGDHDAVRRVLDRLKNLAPGWRPETRKALQAVREAVVGKPAEFPAASGLLRNLLTGEASFTRSAQELKPTGDAEGLPLETFRKLADVQTLAAPPDTALSYPFTRFRLQPGILDQGWSIVVPAWLETRSGPSLWVASAREARRADGPSPAFPFPSGKVPPTQQGMLFADLDNDGLADLVLAGAGGLRFWKRKADGGWQDVTTATKLPGEITQGDWARAWAADLDMDADLDIVLAPRKGPTVVLRNNADGTFATIKTFDAVAAPSSFVWADLDNDGAPEACFIDGDGKPRVFMNHRSGQFIPRKASAVKAKAVGLAAGDLRNEGKLGLVILDAEGQLRLACLKEEEWEIAEIAKLSTPPTEASLAVADMDNNAAFDLVVRDSRSTTIFLGDGKGGFSLLEPRDSEGRPLPLPEGRATPLDYDGDGLLDLAGLTGGGMPSPLLAMGKGQRNYRWEQVRFLGDASGQAAGDQRINTFNLGGEIEMRTGRLILKQPITSPVSHFGLGTNKRAHLTRILATNGTAQWEFDRPASSFLVAEQRLKGSCPFLFAWNGERMAFVNDFLWSTPLGMYINGQDKGGFLQTTDWIAVRGEQLQPRDGVYDLRVNANLWETHFIDELGLMAVDHPAGTEMHIDERFFLSPNVPKVFLTERSRPVAMARDHDGKDVSAIIQERDGHYLDRAGRGKYQGITKDHWVEIDLGGDAPKTGETYLIATGWIHPTDSSINFALSQSSSIKPSPLVLEVPDGKGGWRVGRASLGFPAGKNKTLVIRLDGIEGKTVSRRVRLRTNLEIFWDRLAWARGLDPSLCQTRRLPIKSAELRYRGILEMSQADQSSPELPHYDRIVHLGGKWRDLVGFHTRFGDVKELLVKPDDRYVIMNAGDEVRLTFDAPAATKRMKRDYVWIADGWVKDGDLNTRWGNTVLPLPYHGMTGYDTPPGRLEDDPVYRRFPKDWQKYHTRHVTPAAFARGLHPRRKP